jgi:hypothetical protein
VDVPLERPNEAIYADVLTYVGPNTVNLDLARNVVYEGYGDFARLFTQSRQSHLMHLSLYETINAGPVIVMMARGLAARLAQVPEAKAVVADVSGPEPVIRTYIERRDVRVRRRIYQREQKVSLEWPGVLVDFQVASLDRPGSRVPDSDSPNLFVWSVR